MSTEAIRLSAADMDERGRDCGQFLLVCWLTDGTIVHYMSEAVGEDPLGHLADYRTALVRSTTGYEAQ